MSVFADDAATMVGKLAAAGLPATRRPDAVPPFVLVGPMTQAQGDHATWPAEVPVVCAVAPPSDLAALDALYELVQTVETTLGSAVSAVPGPIVTGGKELPAYTLTYRVTFPNPTC